MSWTKTAAATIDDAKGRSYGTTAKRAPRDFYGTLLAGADHPGSALFALDVARGKDDRWYNQGFAEDDVQKLRDAASFMRTWEGGFYDPDSESVMGYDPASKRFQVISPRGKASPGLLYALHKMRQAPERKRRKVDLVDALPDTEYDVETGAAPWMLEMDDPNFADYLVKGDWATSGRAKRMLETMNKRLESPSPGSFHNVGDVEYRPGLRGWLDRASDVIF